MCFRYVYSQKVSVIPHRALELLPLADHYQLPGLRCLLINYLNEYTTPRTVSLRLSQADTSNNQQLMDSCLQIIAYHGRSVFTSKYFQSLPSHLLLKVCSMPEINASEIEIFRACHAWAKCQLVGKGVRITPSGLHTSLGPILHKIRFRLMKRVEQQEVLNTEILNVNSGEGFEILRQWLASDNQTGSRKSFTKEKMTAAFWDETK